MTAEFSGFSLSWVALKDVSAERALEAFKLAPGDGSKTLKETGLGAAMLPNGWYLLIANDDHRYGDGGLDTIIGSLGCDAIACWVDGHVMISEAHGWRAGARVWSVLHDGSEFGVGLQSEGDPPDPYEGLSDQAVEELDGNAGFAVPTQLAEALIGFRHDTTELSFETLVDRSPQRPKERGAFSHLLGFGDEE